MIKESNYILKPDEWFDKLPKELQDKFRKNPYECLLEATICDEKVKSVYHSYHDKKHYVSIRIVHPQKELADLGICELYFGASHSFDDAILEAFCKYLGVIDAVGF